MLDFRLNQHAPAAIDGLSPPFVPLLLCPPHTLPRRGTAIEVYFPYAGSAQGSGHVSRNVCPLRNSSQTEGSSFLRIVRSQANRMRSSLCHGNTETKFPRGLLSNPCGRNRNLPSFVN